jgi:ABC-type glycerol-3-phosphate transport system substrate-binding protein
LSSLSFSSAAVEKKRAVPGYRTPKRTDWQSPALGEGLRAGRGLPTPPTTGPKVSNVAGTLRYALTPPGPNGMRVQDTYFWSLAMNPASYHKIASWLFIQWATSKSVMLHTTMEYQNWNPSRKSVWEDPRVVAESEKWANYRQVVEDSRRYGKVVHSVNPCLVATHDVWWSNVRDAIAGDITVEDALKKSERAMRSITTEAQLRT